jgi:hypothetical protein
LEYGGAEDEGKIVTTKFHEGNMQKRSSFVILRVLRGSGVRLSKVQLTAPENSGLMASFEPQFRIS